MTRIDHTGHDHPNTAAGRAACRKISALVAHAERVGVVVTTTDIGTLEFRRGNHRDDWQARVWAFVRPEHVTFMVYQGYPTEPRKVTDQMAHIWLDTMAKGS